MAVTQQTMTDEQLVPNYAGLDTERYPWLGQSGRDPSTPLG
jgi:hypothetical protein